MILLENMYINVIKVVFVSDIDGESVALGVAEGASLDRGSGPNFATF